MNEFERRIRRLFSGLSTWWAKRRSEGTAGLRRDAAATAQRATSAMHDLRDSQAGKRAATALTDLRQREPVRKAEESARRALHDLRSGNGKSGSAAS